jgi:S1-C subfamily serine protease
MITRVKQASFPIIVALILGLGLGLMAPFHTIKGDTTTDDESDLLKNVYAQVNPSVVSIDVRIPASTTGDSSGSQGNPGGAGAQFAAGSGWVYDTAGHIVTNAHVVQGTDQVEVTFSDDTQFHAKIVGIDIDSDLAVIQVQGDASKYKPLQLADSNALVVGDRAIAIGNPFQEAGTMTQGIVSGLHRSVQGLNQSQSGSFTIPDAIQTDAALNPGNSGGPLLNSQGQVIGVNEQIASQVRQSSGVSFAIPSNLTKQVIDKLIASGSIEHTWLGISGLSLSLDVNEAMKLPTETRGVLIESVSPNSPAAKAGLKAGTQQTIVNGGNALLGGDIIVAIDGQPVKRFEDMVSYLFTNTNVGQTVKLTILRGGKQQDVSVTLTARPHNPAG